jgi:hypothetical protein
MIFERFIIDNTLSVPSVPCPLAGIVVLVSQVKIPSFLSHGVVLAAADHWVARPLNFGAWGRSDRRLGRGLIEAQP